MAHYWLKLRLSLIDDPAYMRLSKNLRFTYIALMILAKELGDEGYLPAVEDMAWRMREDAKELENDISQLAMKELAEWDIEKDCWFLPGFAEMQRPTPAAERMKAYRERLKQQEKDDSKGDLPILEEKEEEKRRSELDIYIDRSVTVVTKSNNKVTDMTDEQLVNLVFEVQEFWFDQTGGTRPADEVRYRQEYFKPLNQLLVRCGWDTGKARELLKNKREEWLKNGWGPRKADSVVTSIISDLDRAGLDETPVEDDSIFLKAIGAAV